jgi:hypothetical protein
MGHVTPNTLGALQPRLNNDGLDHRLPASLRQQNRRWSTTYTLANFPVGS